MSNAVFANGREIACKAGSGKVIAAFPDTCFTPPDKVPPTPPGVPVPYPLTSMASDTDKGSKNVVVSNKEVMKRDSSCFKKCIGDNAAQTAKKGLINSKLTGKVQFTAWSMDVKFEGKNAVRHLDNTTSNHASPLANASVPWPFVDSFANSSDDPCKEDKEAEQKACEGATQKSSRELDCSSCAEEQACIKAKQCKLVAKKDDKKSCCAPHHTGHHLLPASSCVGAIPGYEVAAAPCVCAGGYSWHRNCNAPIPVSEKTHPMLHEYQDVVARKIIMIATKLKDAYKAKGLSVDKPWRYKNAKKVGLQAHRNVFGNHCSEGCLDAQLDAYHAPNKGDQERPLKAKAFGNKIPSSDPFLKNHP